jgi:hypothetical protein
VAASAVVSTAADRSRGCWTMFNSSMRSRNVQEFKEVQKVQAQEILVFYRNKLLHRAMLRIERRCGSMNVQNVQDVQRFNAQKIM